MNSTELRLSATLDAAVHHHPVSAGASARSSRDNPASQPLCSMPNEERNLAAFQARIIGRGLQAIWEGWAMECVGTEGRDTSWEETSAVGSLSSRQESFHRRGLSGTSTGHNSTGSVNSSESAFEGVYMATDVAEPAWDPAGSFDFFMSDSSNLSFLQ